MNVYTAFAVAFVSGLASTVYFATHDCPWWAFGTLLITATLEVRKSEK